MMAMNNRPTEAYLDDLKDASVILGNIGSLKFLMKGFFDELD